MVYIVGLGPGHKDYIVPKALDILKKSHVIIGFGRAIKGLDFIEVNKEEVKSIKEVIEYIKLNEDKDISVVASGDPNFYGISNYIRNNYHGDLEIIPGISSFQYLCCKLNKSWNGAFLGSLHGREEDFLQGVKNNNLSIWLTDKKNFPGNMCKILMENNIEALLYVGENLSYEDEKITIDNPKNILEKEFSGLSIVIIEKQDGEIK